MSSLAVLAEQVEKAVAALNAAVAEAGFDTDSTDAELHHATVALHKAESALTVGSCRVLARWHARRVWAPGGYRSAASRLAHDTMLSKPSANRALRRARALTSMPATANAVTAGALSVDHLDLFARANRPHRRDLFADHEETLVGECSKLQWSETLRAVHYWCNRADAATGHEPKHAETDEHLHASPTIDNTIALNGMLGAISGEIVLNELDRLAEQIRLADLRAGTERTGSQRRAAALVEMATRSATAPANGRRPKPLFTVHVGDETARHLCELASGTVLHPNQLADHLNSAVYESILFDGPSTVLSVSQQRSFTGTLRRAIEARDRHCQHPTGCDIPAPKCDIDHVVPHTQGGATTQFNGRLQCPTHNRNHTKHDHGAEPLPEHWVHRVHTFRARLRWQALRHWEREPPDD